MKLTVRRTAVLAVAFTTALSLAACTKSSSSSSDTSAAGSALGAFMFGMTTEGVIYADWDPDWFMYFVGAMLLLATVFNGWLRNRASTGR